MDIVIIANFCRDFSKTDNGRFMYLAKELSKEHDVEIITSSFSHSKKKQKEPLAIEWPFKITFLKEPGYKKNVSFRRFYSHYKWGIEVKKYLASRKKPDVVYCAVPSLTGPLQAAKYCEKNNLRFIIDIQDLWPEAFRIAFDFPLISDLVFAPFVVYANGIYKRANQIVGVSQTYIDRALSVNSKVSEGISVYLGTELSVFDSNCKTYHVNKNEERLWLGYCGSMGDSYDLKSVIDALAIMNNPPRFIAIGDGEKRSIYENYAVDMKVDCIFTGMLSYEEMCGWLNACDIVVNPITGKSVASIINKHGDYAASGKPIINTQNSQEYRDLVESYNMGINCANGDPVEMASAIQRLMDDSSYRLLQGLNARKCAIERFDRFHTYKIIIDSIVGD